MVWGIGVKTSNMKYGAQLYGGLRNEGYLVGVLILGDFEFWGLFLHPLFSKTPIPGKNVSHCLAADLPFPFLAAGSHCQGLGFLGLGPPVVLQKG